MSGWHWALLAIAFGLNAGADCAAAERRRVEALYRGWP